MFHNNNKTAPDQNPVSTVDEGALLYNNIWTHQAQGVNDT